MGESAAARSAINSGTPSGARELAQGIVIDKAGASHDVNNVWNVGFGMEPRAIVRNGLTCPKKKKKEKKKLLRP